MPISNLDKNERLPKETLGDCSPNMKTAEFVITSNILSQSTQIFNYLGARTEKSLNLVATTYSTHRAPISGSQEGLIDVIT